MKNLLLRASLLLTMLYSAVGAGLVIVAARNQGAGWMHFRPSELILIYFGLFVLPVTILLWIVWAFFRRLKRPDAWVAFTAVGIVLPFAYVAVLSLWRMYA